MIRTKVPIRFYVMGDSDEKVLAKAKAKLAPFIKRGEAFALNGEGWSREWGREKSFAFVPLTKAAEKALIEVARSLGQEALLIDEGGKGALLWVKTGKVEPLGFRSEGKSSEGFSVIDGIGAFHYR